MHKITGRLVNVVDDETKNGKKIKVLQILSPPEGLIHQITGEVVTVSRGTMDGRECQAIRILTNGGKYTNTDKLVDFDLERVWKPGKNIVFGHPLIRQKFGKAVIIFEVTEDQEQKIEGEVFLMPVKDFENREWKLGNILLNVAFKPWLGENSRGLNYRCQVNQG